MISVTVLFPVIILIISFFLFKKVSGSLSLTKLNLISWIFYFQLFAQCFFSAILTLNGFTNHYVLTTVGVDSLLIGSFAILYTLLMLPVGMLIGMYTFGFRGNEINFKNYINKPVTFIFDYKDQHVKFVLYFLSLLAILAVFYVLISVGKVPLFSILSGVDGLDMAGLRQNASRGFSGNSFVKNIFGYMLTPLICYISYIYMRISGRFHDKFWFYIMFIFTFLILTYDFSKSPIVFFSVGFLFINVLIFNGISKKTVFVFSFLSLLFLFFIYSFLLNLDELWSLNSGVFGRIFFSQAAGTYLAFEYFPDVYNHIGFSSISVSLSNLFGLDYTDRAARLIMYGFNPTGVESGTAGVMNSLFIAEAWANWGWAGLLLSPIYVGFIIQSLYMLLLKLPKNPVFIGAYAFLATKIPITGGVNDFIYNPIFFLVFMVVVFIYLLSLSLKRL
ncbi:hypothetical protein CWB89_05765 [Pseudoalteromonas piscicida]|uniref:Oligosaccharide repeat unit polymerase n=1 Tax=Pseudoalteromonas piscicida TaxID=43662 RepID=A0AAQ2EW61_PSEO7|nr:MULTISPECIES: hypothetical protein [Pseudoalteromonas]KJY90470.1 hypothetical protein TW75_07495 [Pseudoalteromonas piscicida]TMN43932.1 hypothetical protein CWB95_04430 [Pseudoalteromonas piscicida]TMN44167.1 hypothetical protein CWB94_02110 [Pseudoalteromonas piscicida]TMN49697.1 hypothetical protein CWB92_14850 [Pseudoalteromonas piscicida]TMN57539.1 hypothetical protein CWB91_04070 [Pseudoalteromonas piscicida]